MDNGFIMVPRAILKYEEMRDCDVLGTYINLLLRARFREAYIDEVKVGVNQILISKADLARKLGFSIAKLRRILAAFEESGGIRCENIRNKYTLITLLPPFLCGGADNNGEKSNPSHKKRTEVISYVEDAEASVYDLSDDLGADEGSELKKEKCDRAERKARGRFGNVYLSEKEYEELKTEFSDADILIEKFSAYLENYTGKPITNHYAKLCQNAIYEKERNCTYGGMPKTAEKNRGYTGKYELIELQPDPDASYDIRRAEERAKSSVPKYIKKSDGRAIPVVSSSSRQEVLPSQ